MDPVKIITDYLRKFLNFFIPAIFKEGSELAKGAKGVSFRYLVSDTLNMVLNAKMLLFFNIAALLVFTVLPAGKDVLLIVAEELSRYRFGNFIWLLVGVTTWSVISEYAVRYSIYVTDNSGHSLPEERVKWRKSLQRGIANTYLFFPFIIILAGLAINYFQYGSLFSSFGKYFGFLLPALSILFIFSQLSKFYLDSDRRKALRKALDKEKAALEGYTYSDDEQDIQGSANEAEANDKKKEDVKPPKGLFKFLLLPNNELEWVRRLLGIYNNYVYTLPAKENFESDVQDDYKHFSKYFDSNDDKDADSKGFPQSNKLTDKARIPADFLLVDFKKDNGNEKSKDKHYIDGKEDAKARYKWVYEIPVSLFPDKDKKDKDDVSDDNHPCCPKKIDFYATLHRQLKVIVLVSVIIIFLVCCMPVRWLDIIGPPGLVCFAFAAWSGVYVGLLFIDYALLRKASFSVRFLLFLLLIASSYFNMDHPYRHSEGVMKDERPGLHEHFSNWIKQYKNDSANLYVTLPASTKDSLRYPVVFICAEGGALRTGAYAALALGHLQDTLLKSENYDFKKSVYAFSSVSGGSLGLGLFNAMGYLQDSAQLRPPYSFDSLAKKFFCADFLSPVLGRMFYSEIIQLFLPFHIDYFDRAIALEKSWELGYRDVIRYNAPSVFDKSYQTVYSKQHTFPAFFINTTEAESGLQCFISNVKPEGFLKNDERDLLNDSMYHKIDHSLLYSTAINFSTRFPLISPAAATAGSDGRTYHYIDGGYVENTGSATMIEILKSLRPIIEREHIIPFVAVLKFSDDANDEFSSIQFGNEATEIINGIYNTRSGRTNTATEELQRYTKNDLHGEFIKLSLEKTSNDVPTNWALSQKSLEHIQKDIDKKWNERYTNNLRPAFFLDTVRYLRVTDSAYYKYVQKKDSFMLTAAPLQNRVDSLQKTIISVRKQIDSLRINKIGSSINVKRGRYPL